MIDIYDDLLEKTKGIKIWDVVPVKDMTSLYRVLLLSQLTEENLLELDFEKNEPRFQTLFCEYDYKMILRKYQYTDLLKVVLDEFKPAFTGPYKKIVKASMLSAKYLVRYSSLDNYRAHLKKTCFDTEHMIVFLESFRHDTSLSAMHFNKACKFFQETGLLDIPYIDKKAKEYLLPLTGSADDNVALFSMLLSTMKKHRIHGYELNERIKSLE